MKTKNRSLFLKVTIWALLLAPILQIYGFGATTFSELILYLLIVIGLTNGYIKLQLPDLLHKYFIYFGLITVVSCLWGLNELIPRLLGVIRLFLVFCLFFSNFKYDYFYKSYKKIAFVIIAIFFAQELSYRTAGIRVSGLVPFFPLVSNFAEMEGSFTFAEHLSLISRSSSVFSEPAIMTQYLLPLFAISIFREEKKIRILIAGASALTILLSQSGNGIIGLAVVSAVYALYYVKKKNSKVLIITVPIACVMALSALLYFAGTDMGQELSGRAVELQDSDNTSEQSSGFFRIYRGYFVYGEYNVIEMVTGINNFALIREKIRQCPFSFTFSENDMYFNTIQNYLIKTGLIGLFLYILFLWRQFKKSDYCSRSIILTLFVLSFMANIYLSYIMILYLLIPYFSNKSEICIKK